MIAGIDPEAVVTLQFSKANAKVVLEWEHATEFEFDGQMFDVIETLEKGDSVLYRCWPDHAETKLNQTLAELVEGIWEKHPPKKNSEQCLLDFFKTVFYENNISWQLQCIVDNHFTPNWLLVFKLPKGALSPPLLPPELG